MGTYQLSLPLNVGSTMIHLRPLFFLICINDVPQCLHETEARLLVDDDK